MVREATDMKKYKIINTMMVVFLALMMLGCQKQDNESEPKVEVKPANVIIDYLQEDAAPDDYIEVTDSRYEDSEYLVSLLITTDSRITDVRFDDVEMGTVTEESTKFFVNQEIYKTEELLPGKPLVLRTEFPNLMPNHTLTYTDTTGEVKTVSIAMSGEDSSIVVAPASFEDGPAPVACANVFMSFISDDEMNDFQSYYQYTDAMYTDSEYMVNVIISTDTTVTDLKIMDAEIGTVTDDTTGFKNKGIIYELKELNPENPLLFRTEFPGDIPSRLVSYIDTDGEEKVYSLSMSGQDGSLVVIPAYIEN